MKNKQNLVIALVVAGLISVALLIVMAITNKPTLAEEVEGTTTETHSCTICGGTGRCSHELTLTKREAYTVKCQGKIEGKECGEELKVYYYECSSCGNTEAAIHQEECKTCGNPAVDAGTMHECKICNGTGKEKHTWQCLGEFNNGITAKKHKLTCTGCFETKEEPHDWSNEDGVCAVCGYECEHDWSDEDGICATCGYECEHNWRNGVCRVCGYECHHRWRNGTCRICDMECEHDWSDEDGICATCGYECEHNWRNGVCRVCGLRCSHTGGTHPDGECETCGYQYETHEPSTTTKYKDKTQTTHTPYKECTETGCDSTFDEEPEEHTITTWEDNGDGTHSGVCPLCNFKVTENHSYGTDDKCKDCKATKPTTECEHNYVVKSDATGHWEECTKCNETKNKAEHTVTTWEDNGDGTHSGVCTLCNFKVTENHSYGTDDKCKDCKATKPTTECEHNYVVKSDATGHWEECTKCNETKNKAEHTVTTWEDNGNGTHSGVCTVCNFKITESHSYGTDDKCKDCKATKPTTECEHNYAVKSDATGHWEECTKCNETKNKAEHTVTTWEDNGNGTHSGTCTVCKFKVTESHTNGTKSDCTKCTYKVTGTKDNEDNNNNDNNNNNGNANGNSGNNSNTNNNADGTSSTKDIPKTGNSSNIVIAIIAFATLASVSIIKIKRYSDV